MRRRLHSALPTARPRSVTGAKCEGRGTERGTAKRNPIVSAAQPRIEVDGNAEESPLATLQNQIQKIEWAEKEPPFNRKPFHL